MPRFRKKPVEIEAVLYTGSPESLDEVLQFANSGDMRALYFAAHRELVIKTLEGDMLAAPGDYIIRGVMGEFYPCKPDIFAATYDPVED